MISMSSEIYLNNICYLLLSLFYHVLSNHYRTIHKYLVLHSTCIYFDIRDKLIFVKSDQKFTFKSLFHSTQRKTHNSILNFLQLFFLL